MPLVASAGVLSHFFLFDFFPRPFPRSTRSAAMQLHCQCCYMLICVFSLRSVHFTSPLPYFYSYLAYPSLRFSFIFRTASRLNHSSARRHCVRCKYGFLCTCFCVLSWSLHFSLPLSSFLSYLSFHSPICAPFKTQSGNNCKLTVEKAVCLLQDLFSFVLLVFSPLSSTSFHFLHFYFFPLSSPIYPSICLFVCFSGGLQDSTRQLPQAER